MIMYNALMVILTSTILSVGAHAGLAGINSESLEDKKDRGFEVKELTITKIENSRALRVEGSYGREGADFRLLVHGTLLLPEEGSETLPRVLVGAYGLGLNEEVSSEIYSALSIDYTPKKISEGVISGDHVFRCSSVTECTVIDEVGTFNFFDGFQPAHLGSLFRPYIFGRSNYEYIKFDGEIFSGGKLTPGFRMALMDKMIELSPDRIVYFEKSQSRPTDSLSYEDHSEHADQARLTDLGKTALERMVMDELFYDEEVTYERKRRSPSGGACTYFCPPSGRYVQVTVFADTHF